MSTNSVLDIYAIFRRELALLLATELKSVDFSHQQMTIFIRLSSGPATMSELSLATQSDKAATTRTIASLVNEGWVKKIADKNDRRSSFVELTASGRRKAAQAMKIRNNIGACLDRALPPASRVQLCEIFQTAITGLQEQRK